MATVDETIGEFNLFSDNTLKGYHRLQKTLDFNKTNRGAGDILQLFKIPKGAKVKEAFIIVDTPEGGTATADLGDGADPDGYIDGVDLDATAGTVVDMSRTLVEGAPNTVTPAFALNGKLYTADDTIDLKVVNAMDTAVIRVIVYALDAVV